VLPKDSLELQRKQSWFQQVAFRQAVFFGYRCSGIIRLV